MESCKTIKNIHDGIIAFIDTKTSFESTQALDDTVESIEKLNSLENIFRVPIENRLFNFSVAMEWLFFINVAIQCIREEAIQVPATFDMSFSVDDAIIYLSNMYDAKKEDLLEYFDEHSSDESEED